MAATKTRIANGRVVLHRKGVKIIINAGEKFDFTQEELDSIEEVNKDAVRKLLDETELAPEAKVPTSKKANLTQAVNAEAAAKADAKAGKKPLTDAEKAAGKSDSEDL